MAIKKTQVSNSVINPVTNYGEEAKVTGKASKSTFEAPKKEAKGNAKATVASNSTGEISNQHPSYKAPKKGKI